MTSSQRASRNPDGADRTNGRNGTNDSKRKGELDHAVGRDRELLQAIGTWVDGDSEDGWLSRIRSTRRAFVAFVGSLFLTPLTPSFAFAQKPNTSLRAPEVLRTLCDHFIPPVGVSPGALALGVDGKLLELFEQGPQGKLALQQLATGLGGSAFLAMPRELQQMRLRGALASGPMSQQLNGILDFCTRSYYSNPGSWPSLGYRTPQPSGYPDYASRCQPAAPAAIPSDGADGAEGANESAQEQGKANEPGEATHGDAG